MKYIKLYTLLILCVSLSSCEDFFQTTLEIDPPEHTPQLAISAFGNTYTNELKVLVTNSVGILEEIVGNASLISNAVVTLRKGNDLVYNLDEINVGSIGSFNYHMPEGIHTFEHGAEYRLNVTTPDYPEAKSSITIPLSIIPESITFEEDGGSDFEDDYSAVDIKFQDPPSQEDFYEVAIVTKNNNSTNLQKEYSTGSFDPAAEEGIENDILNDLSFNGELKSIEFTIDRRPVDQAQNLYVLWSVIPEEHYQFNKTGIAQQNSIDDPFSAPVQLFSNIENGLGIFTIVNKSLIKVD